MPEPGLRDLPPRQHGMAQIAGRIAHWWRIEEAVGDEEQAFGAPGAGGEW